MRQNQQYKSAEYTSQELGSTEKSDVNDLQSQITENDDSLWTEVGTMKDTDYNMQSQLDTNSGQI